MIGSTIIAVAWIIFGILVLLFVLKVGWALLKRLGQNIVPIILTFALVILSGLIFFKPVFETLKFHNVRCVENGIMSSCSPMYIAFGAIIIMGLILFWVIALIYRRF